MSIKIKRMFSPCVLILLILVSCTEINSSVQVNERILTTSPATEFNKEIQVEMVVTEPPNNHTINRGFTEGFDVSYFTDIGINTPNASGNNINGNMVIFNESKNNFYVVDTNNYLDFPNTLGMTFVYQINDNNTVSKLFIDRPVHAFQLSKGDIFSQYFHIFDYTGGYLLSNSHRKPRFFHLDYDTRFSTFIIENNVLWYTLQDNSGIYKYEFSEGDMLMEDMKECAELIIKKSDTNFQVYDDALYYISNGFLYEHRANVDQVIYSLGYADKFLIDEYLVYSDNGELYIALDNEALLIDNHVITFNKLGTDIFYSTGTELRKYSLENKSKEKLLTADSDEGITQVNICKDTLFLQDGEIKMLTLASGRLQMVSTLEEDSEGFYQYFSYNQGYTAHIPKQFAIYLGDGSYGGREALWLDDDKMRFAIIINNEYNKTYTNYDFDDIRKLKTSRERYDVEYAILESEADAVKIWAWRENLWMEIIAQKDYEDEALEQARVFIDSLIIFDWE